jgi:hypothetical protein
MNLLKYMTAVKTFLSQSVKVKHGHARYVFNCYDRWMDGWMDGWIDR